MLRLLRPDGQPDTGTALTTAPYFTLARLATKAPFAKPNDSGVSDELYAKERVESARVILLWLVCGAARMSFQPLIHGLAIPYDNQRDRSIAYIRTALPATALQSPPSALLPLRLCVRKI